MILFPIMTTYSMNPGECPKKLNSIRLIVIFYP